MSPRTEEIIVWILLISALLLAVAGGVILVLRCACP